MPLNESHFEWRIPAQTLDGNPHFWFSATLCLSIFPIHHHRPHTAPINPFDFYRADFSHTFLAAASDREPLT